MSRRAQFKQFNEPVENKNAIMTLERYAEIMQTFPGEVDPQCVTLWIPESAKNRVATINLNHQVDGFNKDGYLTGVNSNCGTRYIIIMVNIDWLTDEPMNKLRSALNGSSQQEDRLIARNIEEITAAINEIHGEA